MLCLNIGFFKLLKHLPRPRFHSIFHYPNITPLYYSSFHFLFHYGGSQSFLWRGFFKGHCQECRGVVLGYVRFRARASGSLCQTNTETHLAAFTKTTAVFLHASMAARTLFGCVVVCAVCRQELEYPAPQHTV